MTLEEKIQQATNSGDLAQTEMRQLFLELRQGLESGEIRAASPVSGRWQVNRYVKEGILLGFKCGELVQTGEPAADATYFDKDTMQPRQFRLQEGVRLVPGGSSVRRGAYVAAGVTIMPPAYINVGAYVGRDTMIDSHALVGSCAQVGRRVHLSAAAQIGGVLEPVGALPVVVEDDVMVGGNCGIYEGVVVRQGAVIGTGTVLNASTAVYDMVKEQIYRATPESPLEIPSRAVVVPGARPLKGAFGQAHGLCIQTPIILKYRDQRTDVRTEREEALSNAKA